MALSTQPHGKVLNYEQFVDHQLRLTRARIKTTDVLTSTMVLVVAALGVLFLEIVLDHAFGLPAWIRRLVLFTGLGAMLVFAVRRILLPLVRNVNGLYAAKAIEETDPTFKNSLINYLELRRHRTEISRSFMAAVENKAVNDLRSVEIDTVVNQRRLVQTVYALAAVVVIICFYALLTPKSIIDSARRALLADVVRPTNTRLINIKPGNDPELARVVAGTHVPFSVEIHGTRPSRVVLHHSVDGGTFYAVKDLTPGKKEYDPWQTTLSNVQQSTDYYLTGGDAESRRYHLNVLPAPMVSSVTHDLDFPTYTGFPDRQGDEGGNIDAIEGTRVTIRARTNQPARSAKLDFGKLADPVRMEINPDDP
ncbi:MAG: hypothetical protein ABI353_13520, partial [Isosphaeraceae bacterium]